MSGINSSEFSLRNKATGTVRAGIHPFSHPKVFRIGEVGGSSSVDMPKVLATGFDALNDELHGGGWQQPGLTEILCDCTGVGEISLLLKAFAISPKKNLAVEATRLLWIIPPGENWVPYAPALVQCEISLEQLAVVRTKSTADALWVAEQGLKSGVCRCVLLRLKETRCSPVSLRRLLQAALSGESAAFLLRPLAAANFPSPAGTRIALRPENGGVLRVEFLKRRGLPAGKSVSVAPRSMACLKKAPRVERQREKSTHTARKWLQRLVYGQQPASPANREHGISHEY
ncbi:MAG: SOS cell division inhibitor SulA [Betaproteobacteria bacterium]|nr:SOS cell division inhibitor SulA [Betaproteobacteria bacterium]